jgi:DNA-binding response OmpR family regulator
MPRHNVLLVAADGERRHRWRLQLADQGYAVFATGDTDVALSWLARHGPRLVITDYPLPGTRIALPHVLKHRGHRGIATIGVVADETLITDRTRQLLGYDALLPSNTPAALVSKRALQLSR